MAVEDIENFIAQLERMEAALPNVPMLEGSESLDDASPDLDYQLAELLALSPYSSCASSPRVKGPPPESLLPLPSDGVGDDWILST